MMNDVWAATQPAGLDGAGESAEPAARNPLLDTKVMMVDDEPLMTDLIQTYLEDAGYTQFVVTNDPCNALDLLRREEPGVLLLDLMMPRVSGFELLEAIRADRALRYTPVIVLTASAGADAKLRALQLGATDFLAKPVDESELALRVRNTLAFHRYHKQVLDFDAVTGLPHPRLFDRGLAEMLQRRDLVGGLVALFSVQVPECRQLRETVDQAIADSLAKALAQRLTRFAADHRADPLLATSPERAPPVCRLGVDHFGLLLEGLADVTAVEAVAQRLIGTLNDPAVFGHHEVVASPWVGVSLSPRDGCTAEALRQAADIASTHARARGDVQYQFASADLNIRSHERFTLGSQLRHAALRGELRLHYQPKLDLAGNRIVGAEALVRWQHPERGLLQPGSFIAMAEELGLIRHIGGWVIERACHDLAAWARAGHGAVKVAVNVSKAQFMAGDLCSVLRRALFDTGVAAGQLVVELTESVLMDDVAAGLAQMHELKALGATLSIDDFGTGYSSLSYLKQFPLDELKIDRSFVRDLPGGHADVAIVRTVVELGHSLGMSVIAEGVETEAQRDCLQRLGCDHYQGYLFSRPVPEADYLRLLGSQRAACPA
jgi:EAL domain-containing protein (putative c-di-GMP-specific phosphodiesterase class I)/PleD family two-component response regulator